MSALGWRNIFMCVRALENLWLQYRASLWLWLKSASGRVLWFDLSCRAFSHHSAEKKPLMYERGGRRNTPTFDSFLPR